MSSDTSESDESLSDFQLTDNIKTENRPPADILSSSSSEESISPIRNTPSKKLATGPTNTLAMNLQHYISKYDHQFVPHMEAAKALDEIESDDEVFIVQASTDFDLKEFADKKLSVKKVNNLETSDGRTIEYYIEDFVKPPNLTLIYGDKAGTNAMKVNTFKPEGKIIIQEKNVLTGGNTETDTLHIKPPQKVPFPKDLRIRHPLLGAFFEDKINLPPKVVKQLCSMRAMKKSKMEDSVEKKFIKTEQAGYLDTAEETPTKKHKKNKIKRERTIELEAGASNDVVDNVEERVTEPSPKKKKIKLEKFDDENDFSWLAKI